MNLHYKIIEAIEENHLIVVRYWTDKISEHMLSCDNFVRDTGVPYRCRSDVSITLPIPVPPAEELEKLILANAPYGWLKTLEDVADPKVDTSMDSIKSLLNVQNTKTQEELDELAKQQEILMFDEKPEITEEEIEELINKITAQ